MNVGEPLLGIASSWCGKRASSFSHRILRIPYVLHRKSINSLLCGQIESTKKRAKSSLKHKSFDTVEIYCNHCANPTPLTESFTRRSSFVLRTLNFAKCSFPPSIFLIPQNIAFSFDLNSAVFDPLVTSLETLRFEAKIKENVWHISKIIKRFKVAEKGKGDCC